MQYEPLIVQGIKKAPEMHSEEHRWYCIKEVGQPSWLVRGKQTPLLRSERSIFFSYFVPRVVLFFLEKIGSDSWHSICHFSGEAKALHTYIKHSWPTHPLLHHDLSFVCLWIVLVINSKAKIWKIDVIQCGVAYQCRLGEPNVRLFVLENTNFNYTKFQWLKTVN